MDDYVCINCGCSAHEHLECLEPERFEVKPYYFFSLADCPGFVPGYKEDVAYIRERQAELQRI